MAAFVLVKFLDAVAFVFVNALLYSYSVKKNSDVMSFLKKILPWCSKTQNSRHSVECLGGQALYRMPRHSIKYLLVQTFYRLPRLSIESLDG